MPRRAKTIRVRFGATDERNSGRWVDYPALAERSSLPRSTHIVPKGLAFKVGRTRMSHARRGWVAPDYRVGVPNQCRGDSTYSLKLSADADRARLEPVKTAERALRQAAVLLRKPRLTGQRRVDKSTAPALTSQRAPRRSFTVPAKTPTL